MRYTFKKGNHYPNFFQRLLNFGVFTAKKHTWSFKIPKETWYKVQKETDWYDTNKLFGITGLISKNKSIRISWLPDTKEGYFLIHAYFYVEGKPTNQYIFTCEGGKAYEIVFNRGKWMGSEILTINTNWANEAIGVNVANPPKFGWYHQPYHGGDLTAPKDYELYISRKRQLSPIIKFIAVAIILALLINYTDSIVFKVTWFVMLAFLFVPVIYSFINLKKK
jgi:hypothetical protein